MSTRLTASHAAAGGYVVSGKLRRAEDITGTGGTGAFWPHHRQSNFILLFQ
jgi:hypothetical protein